MNFPYSQRLLEDALYYGLNLYYINGDNVIMSNGLTPPLNVNSGEIENWGIEANIGYRFNSHWNVNANFIAGCTWKIPFSPLLNTNCMSGSRLRRSLDCIDRNAIY